ncbi:unnamed protein product [Caenorhabditis auriculariae]|uniref:Malectin domain-containing protein n=1 Tax=Caenorhabditis auriculariae TaxID=2777116 RepID=A0A8S1GSB2_9PELO|nr:unnamed protein product [Caenorhabditis auriculariae]
MWVSLLFLCGTTFVSTVRSQQNTDLSRNVVFAVNCGGHGHRGGNNIYYETDENVVGTASDFGTRFAFINANPLDVQLYQTERYHDQDFSYNVALEKGNYVVVLKFSEVYFKRPEQKVFDVLINGILAVRNLDIFKEARGTGFAHDLYVEVAVDKKDVQINGEIADFDGQLEITFSKGRHDNPKINAIAILRGNSAMLPPPPKPAAIIADDEDDEVEWTPAGQHHHEMDDEDVDHSIASGPPTKNPFEEGDGIFWVAVVTALELGEPCCRSEMSYEEQDDVVPDSESVSNDRFSVQQKELDRLEEQNAEYREKLLKTIRERDLNESLLKNIQNDHKKAEEELQRKLRDLQIKLKAVEDKSSAQEAHYNLTIKDLSLKYNQSVGQLTRKADQAEKDKNEAVVKYAMREAELLRVRGDVDKLQKLLDESRAAAEASQRSQAQENVDQLEQTIQNLKVHVETVKHERFDLENRLKIAESRLEAAQLTITETKQQSDVLRKQLLQAKDSRQNALAIESSEAVEKLKKRESELETKLRSVEEDCQRQKSARLEMANKFEESSRETMDLLEKCELLHDQLSLEKERRELCENQIENLKNIEATVFSHEERTEEALRSVETAEMETRTAEKEAAECREQTERLLCITHQLTERNGELSALLLSAQEENGRLKLALEEVQTVTSNEEAEKVRTNKEVEEISNEPIAAETAEEPLPSTSSTSVENEKAINSLRLELDACEKKLQNALENLDEERNSLAAYKKKTNATVKELRQELAALRKTSAPAEVPQTPSEAVSTSISTRSRASSIVSLDRATEGSREDDSQANAVRAQAMEQQAVQQTMIDKIIVLQRKLARRNEKVEFLEEHIRQCLEELQRKTRLIQQFALREEASLLLPTDNTMEKLFASCEFVQVPIIRRGSVHALMGSSFIAAGEKKGTQIACELNSRLQAVLEDVLQKNIVLKSTADTLSTENTRLARENRLLSLSLARDRPS